MAKSYKKDDSTFNQVLRQMAQSEREARHRKNKPLTEQQKQQLQADKAIQRQKQIEAEKQKQQQAEKQQIRFANGIPPEFYESEAYKQTLAQIKNRRKRKNSK